MYDIRQFRPAIYLLLVLGIGGFALAAQSPLLFVFGMLGVGLNVILVALGRFRPMPRMLANLATVTAVAFALYQKSFAGLPMVMLVGEFLLCMQLIKLWEQRVNRDWALLLILSLLLMVAAAMNTASLWFGIILAIYLVVSLYCCLLFHLKVETDAAMKAMPLPPEKLSPATLRQDQRYLGRSMQRLTAMVAAFSVVFAVFVFVIFPRGAGGGMLGPLSQLHAAHLTGFSDRVEFQDVAKITQSHERVAFVKLFHNGKLVEGTESFYLRGTTLDRYQQPPQLSGFWQWVRSTQASGPPKLLSPGESFPIMARGQDNWVQQITLWPTHSPVLFAMPGPARFTPGHMLLINYFPGDQSIQMPTALTDRLEYEVASTGAPQKPDEKFMQFPSGSRMRATFPRIFAFARQPGVCGGTATSSLGDQRVALGNKITALDGQIASHIEQYLRDNFTYTLDLSDEASIRGQNPIEVFLYKWKRGHCEYFAGAMTLMCQTLGMHARMVVGFHCGPENYNSFTQSYTVFDSDAHAWVEVETPNGWETFDPTSSRTYDARNMGLLARLRNLKEYLEFNYANNVVAYDAQDRINVLAAVEGALMQGTTRAADALSETGYLIANSSSFWDASTIVLTCIVMLMLGVLAAAFGWFLWERWRLLRRAQRIGIESLPEDQQLRLARQLGFYDELLRMLERHRIIPPAHFTPLEFSRSLTFLPAGTYDTIQRLTRLFYQVRYGGVELTAPRQRHLGNVLGRLHQELEAGDAVP